MLAFEVEFLTGVSVAATPHTRERAEWPPHPDRLFQALVAAWGREAEPDKAERAALEWLEALPTDGFRVVAPKAAEREVVTVFVPPNDARTTGKAGEKAPNDLKPALRVIPSLRTNRQPRAFPAVVPEADRVLYVWPDAQAIDAHRTALARLAAEVTYLGHSHSLVRVALVENGGVDVEDGWLGADGASLRLPYPGRLQHLREQYARTLEEERVARPLPSLVTKRFVASSAPAPTTLFDPETVTVLADDGGFAPSLEAFPLVAKRLRDALLDTGGTGPIPTLLSGHDPDGKPTAAAHLAIVPLADVGWKHSRGRLMGLALLWPRDALDDERRAAMRILAAFLRQDKPGVPLLHFGRDGSWQLALDPEPNRASLRFGRYVRSSRRWGSVLPVALDRHPKGKPDQSLADIVARACENIGLPSAAIGELQIEVHQHSAVTGAPSVRSIRHALARDSRYRDRPLHHLVLTFPQLVRGPLVIGAGRFRGLGFFLPIDEGT